MDELDREERRFGLEPNPGRPTCGHRVESAALCFGKLFDGCQRRLTLSLPSNGGVGLRRGGSSGYLFLAMIAANPDNVSPLFGISDVRGDGLDAIANDAGTFRERAARDCDRDLGPCGVGGASSRIAVICTIAPTRIALRSKPCVRRSVRGRETRLAIAGVG